MWSPFVLQYITAVLPAGPNGESQYVTLPADPRVMSGQYSYAMLQQPDGSQSIVLVENNNNNSAGTCGYSGLHSCSMNSKTLLPFMVSLSGYFKSTVAL